MEYTVNKRSRLSCSESGRENCC